MEWVVVSGVAVCVILMGVTVFLTAKSARKNERRLRKMEEEIGEWIESQSAGQTAGSAALKAELGIQLEQSVRVLGELLSSGQQTASAANSASIAALERQLFTSQSALSDALRGSLEAQSRQLEALRGEVSRQLGQMREENASAMVQMRQTVDEKLQTTLERKMNESFKQVSERLEQVYKGLGEMQTLASGVGDLKKVLSNVKTRGILGEIQLGAILSEILAPEQYLTDVATVSGSRNRVEFAVKLPGEDGAVLLPIDSKFPTDAYAALQAAYDSTDSERIKSAGAVLEARIKSFAKDIHDKYIAPPETTAFGIMFLPSEGLYAEAVNRGLSEAVQRSYNISIAGPSTMAALLNALQMGFQTLALQKRSQQVWQLLGAVRTEFDRFTEVLVSTQKRLQLAGDDLDRLVGVRTRAINRRLREVERLDETSARELLDE
ncbi:MAG: DNA recombination protein RmuC [Candidatus Faecivivens sp.]|nr:DNA recombination protein RmuC [Candidatus Faecivivens sp.]